MSDERDVRLERCLKHGQEILPNRKAQNFFKALTERSHVMQPKETRRIVVENVLQAANDCLMAEGSAEGSNIDTFKEKVFAKEVPYNLDELEVGKSTVDALLQRDLAEGRCHKYTLKIMSDG